MGNSQGPQTVDSLQIPDTHKRLGPRTTPPTPPRTQDQTHGLFKPMLHVTKVNFSAFNKPNITMGSKGQSDPAPMRANPTPLNPQQEKTPGGYKGSLRNTGQTGTIRTHTRWGKGATPHIPLPETAQPQNLTVESKKFRTLTSDPDLFTNVNRLTQVISQIKVDRKNTVVNLSSRVLTHPEETLLQKGLNFCPTPGEPSLSEIHNDLEKFHNNLRWKQFFLNQPSSQSNVDKAILRSKLLKPETTHRPPQGSSLLETFATLNDIHLSKAKIVSPNQKNLLAEEKTSIQNLFRDKSITVKPADKGGAVVILDTRDYIAEAERQLDNPKYYKKVDTDLTIQHTIQVNQYVEGLHRAGEISGRIKDRLTSKKTRTPHLYLLPKIHKQGSPPPGRPVVSANSCPTERISTYIDILTKNMVPKIPSYIKDTGHFLQILKDIKQPLPDGTILCTLDVTSLYTNIPNEEGRRAMAYWLSRYRPQKTIPNLQPSNPSLLTLLRMVLELNNFQFNGQNYLQIGGTAMGTRVAPTFANLFMGYFEEKHVYTYKVQPTLWVRFIDDIFLVWPHGMEELKSFITYLNLVHDTIKFTATMSFDKIPFLDTLVMIDDNIIHTDLYTKPTDANNFLHFDSAHPKHCKKGIPFGQFLRLRRICSRDEDFNRQVLIKAAHFRARGYPLNLIVEACQKAWRTGGPNAPDREERGKDGDLNILVTTFHPTFNNLFKIVRDNWEMLSRSNRTKPIHDNKLIFALRRPPNLRSQLVRARTDFHPDPFSKHPSAVSGRTYNICDNKNCRYCPRINVGGKITSRMTKRTYSAKINISCQSSNLVYCMSCKKCGTQYVGQTKRRIMDRFQDHFHKISRNIPASDIGKHFNSADHRGLDDVEIFVVDFIHCSPESEIARKLRHMIEKNWIFRLRTQIPDGLNLIDAPVYD